MDGLGVALAQYINIRLDISECQHQKYAVVYQQGGSALDIEYFQCRK